MRRYRRMYRYPIHIGVCTLYTLLALLLTWPLARHFSTHVPGDGIDDPALAWNLWWIKERLVDQRTLDIFHVDWMFFPIEINLGFYTLTPLNGLLSVPLQTAIDLVVASNVVLLSSFVLGGYGTFLLVRALLAWERGAGSGERGSGIRRRASNINASVTDPQPPVVDRQSPVARRQSPNPQSPIPSPQSPVPPIVAGIVYAFASSKLFYASLGQFNIASSQWIPFAVLYVLRAGRSHRGRDALLAGLFLTLQAWAELTYASFLLIFIALYVAWVLLFGDEGLRTKDGAQRSSASRLSLISPFFLVGAVFALGIAPFLWAMLPDLLREGDFFASGGGFADIFSADLFGYLVPTRLHPLWGDWVATLPFPNDKGQQIYVGYTVLITATIGAVWLIHRRGWRGIFWPLMAFWFFWLTLGERVRWMDEATAIPGPFALVSQLPFFSGNRYPSRYSVMLMLCVAVLVGYGIAGIGDWLWGRPRTRTSPRFLIPDHEVGAQHHPRSPITKWVRSTIPNPQSLLSLLFVVLFLFEHLAAPLPLSDFRVPSIYEQIAAEPGDFAVLELPTGWRNGARVLGKSDVLIMMQQWYQTVHGKRRLGGNTSRNPPYKFQYFTDAPLIGDLIALMNADVPGPDGTPYLASAVEEEWDDLVARNRPIAPYVLDFLNVRFVTLHVEKASPALIRFVEEVLPVTPVDEWQGADWAGAPSTIRLYEVATDPADEARSIALGTPLARLHLAEGWAALGRDDFARLTQRETADLLLDLPEEGSVLTVDPVDDAADLVAVSLNGHRIWDAAEGAPIRVEVPPGVADRPVDRLSLRFDRILPATEVLAGSESAGAVGATKALPPVGRALFVESAGSDVGDFAHIYLDGVDVAQNRRGYNLVALDGKGTVLESVVFDTHASTADSDAMAAWLRKWEPGTVIAGAVRDEASHQLTRDGVDGLRTIGVRTDLRHQFRASHAFVGVVGAPPGSAEETRTRLRPARVTVGAPLDAPGVGGGVAQIHWQMNPGGDE